MDFISFVHDTENINIKKFKEEVSKLNITNEDIRKDIENKLAEIEKLGEGRELIEEALVVGRLNLDNLIGKKVSLESYPNPILKLDREDTSKIIKHSIYNCGKITALNSMLPELSVYTPKLNLSNESFSNTLLDYKITVEGLGDAFSAIGEKIKSAVKYVLEKIKQFFNWITGNSNKTDEMISCASSAQIPAEISGTKLGDGDKKTEGGQNNQNANSQQADNNQNAPGLADQLASMKGETKDLGTMTTEQRGQEIVKATAAAIDYLDKVSANPSHGNGATNLTDEDLVKISAFFNAVNLGDQLLKVIRKRATVYVDGVNQQIIDGKQVNKSVKVKQYSAAKVKEVLEGFKKDIESTFVQKVKEKAQAVVDGAKKIGGKAKKLLYAIGGLFKRKKKDGKDEENKEGQEGPNETPTGTIQDRAAACLTEDTIVALKYDNDLLIYDIGSFDKHNENIANILNKYSGFLATAAESGKTVAAKGNVAPQFNPGKATGKAAPKPGVEVQDKSNSKKPEANKIRLVLSKTDLDQLTKAGQALIKESAKFHQNFTGLISNGTIVLKTNIDLNAAKFISIGTKLTKAIYTIPQTQDMDITKMKFQEIEFEFSQNAFKGFLQEFNNKTVAEGDNKLKSVANWCNNKEKTTVANAKNSLGKIEADIKKLQETIGKLNGQNYDNKDVKQIEKTVDNVLSYTSRFMVAQANRITAIMSAVEWLEQYINEVHASSGDETTDEMNAQLAVLSEILKKHSGDDNGAQQPEQPANPQPVQNQAAQTQPQAQQPQPQQQNQQ